MKFLFWGYLGDIILLQVCIQLQLMSLDVLSVPFCSPYLTFKTFYALQVIIM